MITKASIKKILDVAEMHDYYGAITIEIQMELKGSRSRNLDLFYGTSFCDKSKNKK